MADPVTLSGTPQGSLFGSPLGGWTDPRMLLAQQLIAGSTDTSPIRSWTQELARALSGPIGAYELGKVRDQQMQGYAAMAGIPIQQQPDNSGPGLLSRIGSSVGNFLGVGGQENSAANAPGPGSTAPPSATPSPSGSPPGPQVTIPTMTPASGAPAPPPSIAPGQPTASGSTQAAPAITPGAVVAATNYAQRMIAAGMQSGNFALVQQGSQLLTQIREKQAESEMSANTDLAKQGLRLNADGSVSKIGNYDTSVAATKQAEATGTAMGGLAPEVTAGKITQTNAINTGTTQSEAAKAGAVSNATAMGANAPNVGQEKAANDALSTIATNAANAQKPLTPEQTNAQEQKLSQDFQGTEAYKNHYNAIEGYKNVLTAAQGNTKASDINLIDGLVKMFNPGATVRQATFQNFLEHSQGIPENLRGAIQTVWGNNAHLTPQTRTELVAEATSRMNASRQLYNPVVSFLSQTAKNQGLNPANVVPPLIDPITAREIAIQRGLAQ